MTEFNKKTESSTYRKRASLSSKKNIAQKVKEQFENVSQDKFVKSLINSESIPILNVDELNKLIEGKEKQENHVNISAVVPRQSSDEFDRSEKGGKWFNRVNKYGSKVDLEELSNVFSETIDKSRVVVGLDPKSIDRLKVVTIKPGGVVELDPESVDRLKVVTIKPGGVVELNPESILRLNRGTKGFTKNFKIKLFTSAEADALKREEETKKEILDGYVQPTYKKKLEKFNKLIDCDTSTSNSVFPASIVKIIDDYSVVINRGLEHGVFKGDKFLIYGVEAQEIIDPETQESLGNLEIIKGTGIATHVQDKMTTVTSNLHGYKKQNSEKQNLSSSKKDSEIENNSTEQRLPFNNLSISDKVKPI